jgi:hypothetical protein
MTTPRHRRPDRERTNPASEYFVPNDPANRAAQPVNGRRPQNIPRRTLLEASADLGGTVEEAKLKKRLRQAQDENGGHSEPTTCPLCGLTEIQALATKQPPAMIVGPGTVLCSCRGEPFHVGTELAKLRGERDKARAEILECYYEDVHRAHEPGSTSKGRTRTPVPKAEVRLEQEWHGFAADEEEEVERLHKFVVCLKGKVPRAIKARLKVEAKAALTTESHLLRWYFDRHLRGLEEAFEVEYGTDTVMLKVLVTREDAELWKAMKDVLQAKQVEPTHTVSNADIMTAVMLKEWA